jgi:hypothetical protein
MPNSGDKRLRTGNDTCLYFFFWVFPLRQVKFCRRFGTLSQVHLQRLDILYTAFEDGPDRGFRNVGKILPDAGEIPKRKHTNFRIRRKSEIKDTYLLWLLQMFIYLFRLALLLDID